MPDLGCGEADYLVPLLIPEAEVEVVEVPASGPKDQNSFSFDHQENIVSSRSSI